MAGAFALFEALNIKNTFNVSASILLTSYLQFLDINVKEFHIPGYFLNLKFWITNTYFLHKGVYSRGVPFRLSPFVFRLIFVFFGVSSFVFRSLK